MVVHYLQVGEKRFALTNEDVEKFDSPFLSTLLDSSTPYCKPVDGVYKVEEADERCFASFLFFAQYGVWTMSPTADVDFCLQEADFWGIREKIQEQTRISNGNKQLCKRILENVYYLQNEIFQLSQHHNFRRDDGNGRVYCASCSNRDIDRLFHDGTKRLWDCPSCKCEFPCKSTRVASHYTDCRRCRAKITYNKALGWCHKCSMCKKCQESECPADFPMPANIYDSEDSLEDLKRRLAQATKKLADLH